MDNDRQTKNAASEGTSASHCSIAVTEGELIDLQGIESWLSASDDVCPPDPLGRGLRLRWLKTLASILEQMALKEQLKLMDEWKAHTGWEFMGWDRVKAGDPQGFLFAWRRNVRWIEDNLTEADAIIKAYRDKHDE